MRKALPLLVVLASLAGCADVEHEEDADIAESAATAGPATVLVDTKLGEDTSVRAGGMTLWVNALAAARDVNGEPWARLRFRTSRSLESAASWVPEDGFGDARLVSPRVVEVDLRGGHEVNTILSGMPLFVHLLTTTGVQYDVRLDLGARLGRFEGSSKVYVTAALEPVYFEDGITNLRYRGRVKGTNATAMGVYIGQAPAPALVPAGIGTGAFRFDFDYDRLKGAFVPERAATFTATIAGNKYVKQAGVDLVVSRVGLTTEGADHAWRTPVCAASVEACVASKPAGTKDFAACGNYRDVARCISTDE
jgi:hypothetical protein